MGYIRIMLTLWSEEYHDRLMEVVKIVGDFKSVAVLLNQILTRRVRRKIINDKKCYFIAFYITIKILLIYMYIFLFP